MRKEYIQFAKTELERLQKQGNTVANRRAAEQRADHGNNCRDTPLSGKEKGDTENRCRRNERNKDFVREGPSPADILHLLYQIPEEYEKSSAQEMNRYNVKSQPCFSKY